MAKRVTHAVTTQVEKTYGINKMLRRIACDDGSTYVFTRTVDSPRWEARARIDRDGSRSARPSRLPAAVEAHMDGFTRSGPEGVEGDEYWT